MKKTLYRIAGALILTLDLIMYSVIMQMASLVNASYVQAGFNTDSLFSAIPVYTHVIFIIVLILAIIIGIVVPLKIKN